MIDNYSDDTPWTDPDSERLGYARFADRLADVIVQLDAANGYVIGLSGEWGSGKTSVINFVRHYIDKRAPQREGETASILILDFRPWLFSGHEDLIGAFFKVLGEKLGEKPLRWKQLAANAADLGADLSGALSKLGLLTSHFDAGAVMMGGAAAGKSLGKLAKRWAEKPSLQATYERLRDILAYSATKILVVIDDIDRLQPDEIRAMMTLVKTVGHLPNVIYLLAYDRNVVWPALQNAESEAARGNFAEKLVQQEVSLPAPGYERLLTMLMEQIVFLRLEPNDRRWDELGEVALRRWLRTPRDVLRFANNMRFAWPTLCDHLDPVDYVAIEGARTFDKLLFDWIRDNPFVLFESRRHSYDPNHTYDVARELKNKLLTSDAPSSTELAGFLFPHMKKYFSYANEDEAKAGKKVLLGPSYQAAIDRQSLAQAAAYDTYFRLYISDELIGRAALANFFDHLDDEVYLHSALRRGTEVRSNRAFYCAFPLFDAVAARLQERQIRASAALLNASFEVFSELCDHNSDGKSWDEQRAGQRLFESVARTMPADALISCLQLKRDIGALYAVTLIAEDVRRREGKFNLNEDQRKILLDVVRERVQKAADDGQLGTLQSLHAAMTTWVNGDEDVSAPRTWLAIHLDELWLLPRLVYFFDEYLNPISPRERIYSIGRMIPLFFDLNRLRVAAMRQIEVEVDHEWLWCSLIGAIDSAQSQLHSATGSSLPP